MRGTTKSILVVLGALVVVAYVAFTSYSSSADVIIVESEASGSSTVHVVMCAEKDQLVAMLAALASVVENTASHIKVHVITLPGSATPIENGLKASLHGLDHEVIVFNTSMVEGKIVVRGSRPELAHPLNYARNFMAQLLSDVHGRVVYLDTDVIVTGDIAELAATPMQPHQPIAVSTDCHPFFAELGLFSNTYEGFLNYQNAHIQKLNIPKDTCSFNVGVFVANLDMWRQQGYAEQLDHWLTLNSQEKVYGTGPAGGGSQPPFLIVFYNKFAEFDPHWHFRGFTSDAFGGRWPETILRSQGKLLHWNGARKPWKEESVRLQDLWRRYRLPTAIAP